MAEAVLKITDLHVSVEDKPILRGVDLEIPKGQVHAIMGPNGSGKSTLAQVLLGNPAYQVTQGSIVFKGTDMTELAPDERARLGMFLAFQYPVEVPGVSVSNFLRTAMNALRGEDVPIREFMGKLREELGLIGLDPAFASRNLNEGFSGGEKKRAEILQLTLLAPELAVLDETDSGLDIDGVRVVAEAVNRLRGPDISVRCDHSLHAHPELRLPRRRTHPARWTRRTLGRKRACRPPRGSRVRRIAQGIRYRYR